MTARAPSADFAGLERYAYRLICQSAEDAVQRPGATKRLTAAALDPKRLAQAASPGLPPVPLAYQLWLGYLLWLEEALRALDAGPDGVTAAELSGLQALARARDRFLRSHDFCPRCHAVTPRSFAAKRCRRCGDGLSVPGTQY